MSLNAFVKGSIRSYFSNNFITSAAFFAQQAGIIEDGEPDNVTQEQKNQDQAFVLGSIVFSVTFLEALVNELAEDYSMERYHQYPKLDNSRHTKIASSWRLELYPTSILDKYQHTLMLADKPLFQKGQNPYQNVNLLIKLRNHIIHYQSEDVEAFNTNPDENFETHTMEGRLHDKFKPNALYGDSYNYFPLRCFGQGCAQWSVQSARSFGNDFFDKLGISNHAQKRWNELETE